jgi:protein TonB
MDLRCLVFSSDQGAAEPICQVLAELGGEAEHCTENVSAVQRVAAEPFQIVIADWDEQPDAEFLLKAVRARKASERPLTLAIVSDDASVSKALQAGANSILRKPILVNQVKDTLQTARSLLKARRESAQSAAAGAASPLASTHAIPLVPPEEAHLRAGEFLQTTAPAPATQIDTESEMQKSMEEFAAAQVDPLKDLEPMAAAVAQASQPPASLAPGKDEEPRGLEWYLKRRAGSVAAAGQTGATAAASVPAPVAVPEKPELLGFDQISTAPAAPVRESTVPSSGPTADSEAEKKSEARLFAYIEGEGKEPEEKTPGSSRLGKRAIAAALILAACAVVAAPQAPWHAQERTLWTRGQQVLHAWLNPQLVTPVQAPVSHEDFARPGDEYKLPAAEPIPDATTDPSQIKVTPMVDPTAKKPNTTTGDQGATVDTAASPDPTQPAQAPQIQVQENPPATTTTTPAATASASGSAPGTSAPVTVPQTNLATAPVAVSTPPVVPARPKPSAGVAPAKSNMSIPTSLKSQMASMTPEASGNKAPETALPSIEPVEAPEATERALLTTQPAIAYPANAKGQQGTVVLQVLVGRDGSVQDAMFLQGSLAFARAAIDGVKQWAFKPYLMNGRPVSVQTKLTLHFQPGQ